MKHAMLFSALAYAGLTEKACDDGCAFSAERVLVSASAVPITGQGGGGGEG